MVPNAKVLEKRYNFQCDICMAIDSENKSMKWHLYKEGFMEDNDRYVCDECVTGVMEIRKQCHQKFDNPKHPIFKDFIPWFAKEVPGMVDGFKGIPVSQK